jgi:hypothetical protein
MAAAGPLTITFDAEVLIQGVPVHLWARKQRAMASSFLHTVDELEKAFRIPPAITQSGSRSTPMPSKPEMPTQAQKNTLSELGYSAIVEYVGDGDYEATALMRVSEAPGRQGLDATQHHAVDLSPYNAVQKLIRYTERSDLRSSHADEANEILGTTA